MKYIDIERLSEKIESIGLYAQKSADYNDGRDDMKMMVLDLIDSLSKETAKAEGGLEYWLEYFGMPRENIENCITQIAQGYGACRYLEGIQHGAEAANELAKETPTPEQAMQSLDKKIKSAKKSWEGVDADKFMDEVRGREETPQRWISVKDRLPEDSHYVLTCINQGGAPQCLGFHYYLDGRWWDDDDMNEPYNGALDYWMPIPKFKEK